MLGAVVVRAAEPTSLRRNGPAVLPWAAMLASRRSLPCSPPNCRYQRIKMQQIRQEQVASVVASEAGMPGVRDGPTLPRYQKLPGSDGVEVRADSLAPRQLPLTA